MSTILKALKKLEQDKDTIDAKGMRGISRIVATDSPARSRRFAISRRSLRTILISAVICIASMAAVYLFMHNRKQVRNPPISAKASSPVPQSKSAPQQQASSRSAKVTTPKPAREVVKPIRKPVAGKPDTADKPPRRESGGQQARRVRPAQPERDKMQASREPTTTANTARPTSNARPTPAAGALPARKPTPVPEPERSNDQESFASAERLTGNRLKVQAIVWSPDADQRMAVINSSIVREGSTVEGFSVVAIRQDDVIVKEQGQMYRVPFGKP